MDAIDIGTPSAGEAVCIIVYLLSYTNTKLCASNMQCATSTHHNTCSSASTLTSCSYVAWKGVIHCVLFTISFDRWNSMSIVLLAVILVLVVVAISFACVMQWRCNGAATLKQRWNKEVGMQER